jgi:micrococcal nuclease
MLNVLIIILLIILNGCATGDVYVDTDKVPGLGAMVTFPDGKVIPIKVKRVISGNLIELTNKEKVSYIGLHIPKIYNIPERAKLLNEELIANSEIRLEFDKGQRDTKGRLLCYVFTTKGEFINEKIVAEGLAKVFSTPQNTKYEIRLLEAEEGAKNAKKGLWSEDFNQ